MGEWNVKIELEFCEAEFTKWDGGTCNAKFKVLDLEELPLYQEDWLGLASLHNQQKLHKVKSNHENVNILDKLRQFKFGVSNTIFTYVCAFVC